MSPDKRSRYLRYLAILFACIFLISAGFFLVGLYEKNHEPDWNESETMSESLRYEGKEYELRDGIETFLLLGLDTNEQTDLEGYTNKMRADFITLLVVDNNTKTFDAIRINRDTMADVYRLGVAGERIGKDTRQIAIAYSYGNGREVSCRNTADSVSQLLLGAKIDHYLSVTMDAVPIFNDYVGGVEVEIKDDFTGVDDTLVKGQTVRLMGEHALNFVRSRSSMPEPTNLNRMGRQRQYLEALYDQAKKRIAEDDDFAVNAVIKIADYLVTDSTADRLHTFVKKLSGYDLGEIYDIEGENVVGTDFMEFYPDEDSLTKLVIECFYKEK